MSNKTAGKYTEEFKWKVVKEVLDGHLTKEAARILYGIKGNSDILYWMRQYSGIENYKEGGLPLKQSEDMAKLKAEIELQDRLNALEEQLSIEKLRADLWQKMVEVAEKELNIDIKKKYGSRLLKNIEEKKGGDIA